MEQAWAYRVEINDGRPHPSVVINHDIVNLRVAMHDSHVQFATGEGILKQGDNRAALLNKLKQSGTIWSSRHARLSLCTCARHIVFCKIVRCDMEPRKRIDQNRRIHIRDCPMKMSQHNPALFRVSTIPHLIKRCRRGDFGNHPPEVSRGVLDKIIPLTRLNNFGHLPNPVTLA